MDAGIGEAALISAAIGAGTGAAGSAVSGGDPLKGALRGALMGGVTGGIGAGIGGLGGAASTAAESAALNSAATDATIGLDAAGQMANPALTMPTASPYTSANPFTSSGELPSPQDFAGMQSPTTSMPTQNPTILSGTEPQSISGNPLANQTASKGIMDFGYKGTPTNVFGYGPQSNLGLAGIGVGSGLTAAMQAEREKYMPPGLTPYTGILSKYDPYTAKGVQYPTRYAEGGIASLAMGGQPNQMYPMSQQEHTNFMDPSQLPANAMEVRNYQPATNPMTGNMTKPMADGGITSLGSYSDGGRLLKGPGDGMSDNIPATIANKQPARLADGEFVVPADVVSHLGNGSTDAGAKNLYKMMDKVRKARTGNPKQGRQINPNKYMPA
jgi:hypothetical protein